ncbi:LON peptidase substrate-binding domain-containing protein [Rufibacter sediminis]|uniref:LON peptidase substrate-binding domain-containing protein n=1 Tax=Rufibacter sediminis TaxID=2762756 RepID=A0ABR6VRK5_9BACT|nr:LON peptidase substrate-binding domain-containing protein [Rufibacter sediminis]MBC3539787.1 LON peptidase substrate-binding domain-containing protein [Rufibacter sediminis]
MSRFLPLFPLNIVVFPGEKLNLHIFEPRYRQLIMECQTNDTTFGIPVYLENGLGDYGTEIKILSLEKKYLGGEMDIKTKGLGVFKIKEFQRQVPGRLYSGGEVEDLPLIRDEDPFQRIQIVELLKQLYTALGIQSLMLNLPDNFQSYDVAHHLGFSTEQEYELLQCAKESDRLEIILAHLTRVLPVVLETERLKERVKLNGHFKHLIPPNF